MQDAESKLRFWNGATEAPGNARSDCVFQGVSIQDVERAKKSNRRIQRIVDRKGNAATGVPCSFRFNLIVMQPPIIIVNCGEISGVNVVRSHATVADQSVYDSVNFERWIQEITKLKFDIATVDIDSVNALYNVITVACMNVGIR